jgi:hypothetical protein
MLGQITSLKGLEPSPPNKFGLHEASLSEACQLTMRLPSGKVLSFRTRPILIVSCPIGSDIITSVFAPPIAASGRLAAKIAEIEGLLSEWHAAPSKHMRDSLDEYKTYEDRGVGVEAGLLPFSDRLGAADLDQQTEVSFRLSRGPDGRWNVVAEIEAKHAEWERIRHELDARDASTTKPASQPTKAPKAERSAQTRDIEFRLGRRIEEAKGISWPSDGHGGIAWSAGVAENCELTLHLPGGKTLVLKTRPILFANCYVQDGVVTSIYAPPQGKDSSLATKLQEIEGLLTKWGAVPSKHMRALLDEFKTYDDSGAGLEAGVLPFSQLIGAADLDEQTEAMFRLSRGPDGKWDIVAEINIKQAEWDRIRREAPAATAVASRPTTFPTTQR